MSSSKKTSSRDGFAGKAKEEWNARAIILKPLLLFIGIMLAFYIFWATPFFQDNILSKIAAANASIGSWLLNIFGFQTQNLQGQIISPEFSVNVKAGCDGIEAIMICVAGILVYPARWSLKARGIFFGVLFLLVLNLIRIVTLYITGLYYEKAFDFMHLDFWQVLFIILAVITVLVWIQWANKRSPA